MCRVCDNESFKVDEDPQSGSPKAEQARKGVQMRAVDLRCPWGRPGDDCVYRKREAMKYRLHLERISQSKAIVDSSEPTTTHMRHLTIRARKKQNSHDLQHKIAHENRLLLEKMARIMQQPSHRLKSSTSCPALGTSVLEQNRIGVNEPVRRQRQQKIVQENRLLAHRLRELAPHYDRVKLVKDHEQQRQYLKNISRAEKLEQRLQSQRRILRGTLRGRVDTNDEYPASTEAPYAEFASSETPQTRLVLRTAKQIRLDVAKERNHDLPSMFSSPFAIINDRVHLGTQASSIT